MRYFIRTNIKRKTINKSKYKIDYKNISSSFTIRGIVGVYEVCTYPIKDVWKLFSKHHPIESINRTFGVGNQINVGMWRVKTAYTSPLHCSKIRPKQYHIIGYKYTNRRAHVT